MIAHLLLDDEGEIPRSDWWIGHALLVSIHAIIAALANQNLTPVMAGGIKVFAAIAILIPAYSINAKRFRATGRNPDLALFGAVLPALGTLANVYINWTPLDLMLGLGTLIILIWYIIDLGILDHQPVVDRSRLRS